MRLCKLLGIASAVLAMSMPPALSGPAGRLKVCKQGNPSDWEDREFWRGEIVIPEGAVFGDVGPASGSALPEEWWKLRVVTMSKGTIRGDVKCVSVPARVSSFDEDWGDRFADLPLVTRVSPEDGRLLELARFALPDQPRRMAPWADVVPVEATVEHEIKQ